MTPSEPLEALRDLTLERWGVSSRNSVRARAASLGVATGTVRRWNPGHRPRPGFELERRKDGASVSWKVTRQ